MVEGGVPARFVVRGSVGGGAVLRGGNHLLLWVSTAAIEVSSNPEPPSHGRFVTYERAAEPDISLVGRSGRHLTGIRISGGGTDVVSDLRFVGHVDIAEVLTANGWTFGRVWS